MPCYGACLNVEILNPITEIIWLLILVIIGIYDISIDHTLLLYLTKTFVPDYFASKLDRGIWKFLLILSISMVIIFNKYSNDENTIFRLISIWTILALTQLFCELGDNYLENYLFFRHRYSFEISMILVWIFCLPMSKWELEERKLFYFDIIASLSYRINGFLLKLYDLDERKKKKI